jgi:hypothetical protein
VVVVESNKMIEDLIIGSGITAYGAESLNRIYNKIKLC